MKAKIYVVCIACIYLICIKAYAQNISPIHVTIHLTTLTLPADSAVFITGSTDQLGQWNPGKIKMNNTGNRTWSDTFSLSSPTSVEYKFTLGSWLREGAGEDGLPLSNFIALITHDTLINDTIKLWTNAVQRAAPQHEILGTVRYHHLHGEGIADRDIIVWLPPGYGSSHGKRYAVLYMQDGQNIFDPATSSFGAEWRADESCDSLIKKHSITPIIVVGIYNTSDRSAEYSPGEKGDAYMHFVVDKVKPFIDSAYYTIKDRTHTIVGGSSSGGLISFMLAWQYPDVFSRAICMSPAFKIGNLNYVKDVQDYTGKKKPVFFYIDNGGIGLETQLQPGVNAMMAALKAKGYKEKTDFLYMSDPAANHSEMSWAKRFPAALKWCLNAKEF